MFTDRFSIATLQDIPAIERLVNGAYRGDSARKGWTTEADLLDGIRTDEAGLQQMMEEAGAVILLYADPTNEILGCVYLKINGSELYLGMLTVHPEQQAQGIGKKLLTAAEAYALQRGCDTITMTVISVRHELIAWYERKGYRRTGETRP
eukprot:TRINITY_DN89115_c0_g1_i1.p1 TRINITY_DN89115_c0_g1~~TRINITY_DN89115_c0_g1_i1.p1  ORF type:complete len:150 (-),score=18.35 TRINITY_DN89115_c0_g1_i1:70-519(-)